MNVVLQNPDPHPADTGLWFVADAEVGNSNGVYDGACEFGVEGEVRGSAEEIGRAVTEYLAALTTSTVEEMKYGTTRFFLKVVIEPVRR